MSAQQIRLSRPQRNKSQVAKNPPATYGKNEFPSTFIACIRWINKSDVWCHSLFHHFNISSIFRLMTISATTHNDNNKDINSIDSHEIRHFSWFFANFSIRSYRSAHFFFCCWLSASPCIYCLAWSEFEHQLKQKKDHKIKAEKKTHIHDIKHCECVMMAIAKEQHKTVHVYFGEPNRTPLSYSLSSTQSLTNVSYYPHTFQPSEAWTRASWVPCSAIATKNEAAPLLISKRKLIIATWTLYLVPSLVPWWSQWNCEKKEYNLLSSYFFFLTLLSFLLFAFDAVCKFSLIHSNELRLLFHMNIVWSSTLRFSYN